MYLHVLKILRHCKKVINELQDSERSTKKNGNINKN